MNDNIPINELKRSAEEFLTQNELPIVLFDLEGRRLWNSKGLCTFCKNCLEQGPFGSKCRGIYSKAIMQADKIGETYFFSCPLSLSVFVIPLYQKGKLIGGMSTGGFFYKEEIVEAQNRSLNILINVIY